MLSWVIFAHETGRKGREPYFISQHCGHAPILLLPQFLHIRPIHLHWALAKPPSDILERTKLSPSQQKSPLRKGTENKLKARQTNQKADFPFITFLEEEGKEIPYGQKPALPLDSQLKSEARGEDSSSAAVRRDCKHNKASCRQTAQGVIKDCLISHPAHAASNVCQCRRGTRQSRCTAWDVKDRALMVTRCFSSCNGGCPWLLPPAGWWLRAGTVAGTGEGHSGINVACSNSFQPKYLKSPTKWIPSTDKTDQGGAWWYWSCWISSSSWKSQSRNYCRLWRRGVFHKEQTSSPLRTKSAFKVPENALSQPLKVIFVFTQRWALSTVAFRKEMVTEVLGKSGCWKTS